MRAMWLATAAEIREIDRRAIQEYGIPSFALMEQAGFAVFKAVGELVSERGRTVVVCGKGNNGGDGFVVARLLKEHGKPVACLVAAQSESDLSHDAKEEWERATSAGVLPIFGAGEAWQEDLARALAGSEVVVDAILGTGAQGDLQGDVLAAVEAINRSGLPIVAVDVPTGIDCDTGRQQGASVRATRTVTFGLPKPFLCQGTGLERSGRWTVADIGYPPDLQGPTQALMVSAELIARAIPSRTLSSHKGSNGSVLIVAGSKDMPGAASLVAKAALRAGAGLVTVASIDAVCDSVAAQVPEALLLRLPQRDGAIAPEAAPILLGHKARAAVFGPGLGHSDTVLELLRAAWAEWKTSVLLDADALNAIALGVTPPTATRAMTPHPGELARLLKLSVEEIQADRFGAARRASQELGCAVMLKGPYTISALAGEPLLVNTTGNPGMATGGMGDALSGIVGTLLAQGLPPQDALAAGAFWHGLAGDLCFAEIGEVGFTASDLIDRLPRARGSLVA